MINIVKTRNVTRRLRNCLATELMSHTFNKTMSVYIHRINNNRKYHIRAEHHLYSTVLLLVHACSIKCGNKNVVSNNRAYLYPVLSFFYFSLGKKNCNLKS